MLLRDFIEEIDKISFLEIIDNKNEHSIVYNIKLKKKYKINHSSVEQNDWNNIYEVLCGRDPVILDGITRIVGYFSKISNWNQSKLGELVDRRKGEYKIKL